MIYIWDSELSFKEEKSTLSKKQRENIKKKLRLKVACYIWGNRWYIGMNRRQGSM